MKWLKRLKYTHGFTDQQLAEKTGKSVYTVRGWMSGRTPDRSAQIILRRIYDGLESDDIGHDQSGPAAS